MIYKCPIKCQYCSFDSIINNNNLCISCNINNSYYPKYNDSLNKNSFYECYHKDEMQIGYYLDINENIFMSCYQKCKKCEREGNDENNNCLECKDDYGYIDSKGTCYFQKLYSDLNTNSSDNTINSNNESEEKYMNLYIPMI